MFSYIKCLFRHKKTDISSDSNVIVELPIPVPFAICATEVLEAREMLARRPVAELRTAYGQSLAIARQMVRDGVNRRDASDFEALCLGLDLLGLRLPGIKAPECHFTALQPRQSRRRRPLDDSNTDPILLPKKPRKKDRGNDRD